MEQNSYWDASSRCRSQEIPPSFMEPKRSLPFLQEPAIRPHFLIILVNIIRLYYTVTSNVKINIVLPCTTRSFRWSRFFKFSDFNSPFFLFFQARCKPHLSHRTDVVILKMFLEITNYDAHCYIVSFILTSLLLSWNQKRFWTPERE
jgi:hypothetical protein